MARAKAKPKTILLYPEAAFGPALNCVGIAQKLRARGHNPVFVCDRGFKGVIASQGDLGLGLAARLKPSAITLDLRLPDIDGWTVLDRLNRHGLTDEGLGRIG